MPHSGIKKRLLSVAAEEQAKRKTLFSLIIRHLKGFVKYDYKKMPQMRQKSLLSWPWAVLLRGLLSQDLRGIKRLISMTNITFTEDINMNITFEELMELSRKATMYDAIINYIREMPYANRNDIIAITGENICMDSVLPEKAGDFDD